MATVSKTLFTPADGKKKGRIHEADAAFLTTSG
jgi:hypothetical protein